MENKAPNPPRTTANVWWIITAVSACGIFAPWLFGLGGYSGGFAVSIVCILLAITGVITGIIYTLRAGKLDRILKGDDMLAHWTYTPAEWQTYTEEEYSRQKAGNRAMFIIIAVIALAAGLGYSFFNPASRPWVIIAMLGIIVLVGFVSWTTAFYNHRQNKNIQGQAYFTPDAVYINRQLHDFKSLYSKLEHAEIKGDSQRYIEFIYSVPTRYGRQNHEARIPVPSGKDDEAAELVGRYNSLYAISSQ